MEWMLMPLRRYADFQGRSRRMEYWMFVLFTFLIFIVPWILMFVLGATGSHPSPLAIIPALVLLVAALGLIIPSIAVQVRRFHDQDKSGWLVLLGLIPFVGGLIVLVFMCLEGTQGPNQYGPDPKGATAGGF